MKQQTKKSPENNAVVQDDHNVWKIPLIITIAILLLGVFSIWFLAAHPEMRTRKISELGQPEIVQSEYVSYDEDTGVPYVNCRVIIIADEECEESAVEDLAQKYDAGLGKAMASIGVYTLEFGEAKDLEDLQAILADLAHSPIVVDAYLNTLVLQD